MSSDSGSVVGDADGGLAHERRARLSHKRLPHRRAEKREENFNFHVVLAEATGNPVYPLLIRSVVDVMEPIVAPADVPDALARRTLAAHRAIVGYLVQRQGAAAKRELTRHLLEAHACLWRDGGRSGRTLEMSLTM